MQDCEYKYYVRREYFSFKYNMPAWNKYYYCIRIHKTTQVLEFIRYNLTIEASAIPGVSMLDFDTLVEIEDIFSGYLYDNYDIMQ